MDNEGKIEVEDISELGRNDDVEGGGGGCCEVEGGGGDEGGTEVGGSLEGGGVEVSGGGGGGVVDGGGGTGVVGTGGGLLVGCLVEGEEDDVESVVEGEDMVMKEESLEEDREVVMPRGLGGIALLTGRHPHLSQKKTPTFAITRHQSKIPPLSFPTPLPTPDPNYSAHGPPHSSSSHSILYPFIYLASLKPSSAPNR